MSKSVFEPVKITWDKKEYEIPANQVMGLIARIEDHISFADLVGNKPKIGKISTAWAEALRYAGAKVSNEEVYSEMFSGATGSQITSAVSGLMEIMIPPGHLQKKTVVAAGEKSTKSKRKATKTS